MLLTLRSTRRLFRALPPQAKHCTWETAFFMTDTSTATASEEKGERATAPDGKDRRRAFAFIVIFVATVFTLLTGYRFVIDTYANQWYLFQVAQHTSWLLDHVGHSSTLEGGNYLGEDAGRIRAEIAAMEAGTDPASVSVLESQASEPALTPWEMWHYRALRVLSGDHQVAPNEEALSLNNQGPLVFFVAEPSLELELYEAREALEALRQTPTEGEPSPEATQLQAQVDRLTAQLRDRKDNQPREPMGKAFRFKVVPQCGAIEVMAIFLAAILAFPAPWKKRFIGLALGLPLLYGLNIIRLSFLAFVGAWTNGGALFDFAHHYVWQGIYIVFVVAIWLAWMEYIVRRKA
jgi:exosortase/archaeosortase family protein